MIIIGLDTTTRAGGVALVRDEAVVGEVRGDPDATHGARLPGDIARLLDEHALPLAAVDVYGVAAGPGGFTGLRVGMATIQGLALANRRRVVATDALETVARSAVAATPSIVVGDLVAAWINAHRGEVFSALYRWVSDVPERDGRLWGAASSPMTVVDGPAVATPADTLSSWRGELGRGTIVGAGDGAAMYRDTLMAASVTVLPPDASIAPMVALMAAAASADGQTVAPHALRPVYVRRPDAELARDRRGA